MLRLTRGTFGRLSVHPNDPNTLCEFVKCRSQIVKQSTAFVACQHRPDSRLRNSRRIEKNRLQNNSKQRTPMNVSNERDALFHRALVEFYSMICRLWTLSVFFFTAFSFGVLTKCSGFNLSALQPVEPCVLMRLLYWPRQHCLMLPAYSGPATSYALLRIFWIFPSTKRLILFTAPSALLLSHLYSHTTGTVTGAATETALPAIRFAFFNYSPDHTQSSDPDEHLRSLADAIYSCKTSNSFWVFFNVLAKSKIFTLET